MKMIVFVGLLLVVLLLPFFTKAQVPISPEIPQTVTMEEARRFMEEYKNRFMKMDINAFMDLFSKEVVENRMLPYADIREAYGKTFANSNAIQYNLEIYTIQTYQKSAFVRGHYELIQSLKGSKKKEIFRGDIQWDIVREDGLLKIREINYGRTRQDD